MTSSQQEDPLVEGDAVCWGMPRQRRLADGKDHFVWEHYGAVLRTSNERVTVIDDHLKPHTLARSRLRRVSEDRFQLLVRSGIINTFGPETVVE